MVDFAKGNAAAMRKRRQKRNIKARDAARAANPGPLAQPIPLKPPSGGIDFRTANDKAVRRRRVQVRQRRNQIAKRAAQKQNPSPLDATPPWGNPPLTNPSKPLKQPKRKRKITRPSAGKTPRSTTSGGGPTAAPSSVGGGTPAPAPPRTGGGNAPTSGGNTRTAQSRAPGVPGGNPSVQGYGQGPFKPFDVRPFYQPAIDALRQQRAASDATRTANMEGLTKLNEWYANQMNTGQQALQQRLDKSAAESSALTSDSQARMQQYAQGALSAVGNNADLAKQTGLTAATTAGEFGQQGANAGAIFNAAQGLTLSQRQDAERGIQSARISNLLQGLNANHLQRSMNLDTQESGLRGDLAKADLSERIRVQNMNESTRQANVQANIDAALAKFTQDYQAGKLGVEQFKAQTGRIAASSQAKIAQLGLQLKAQGLSLQAGKLKLQQWVAKQNVTEKEKDRLMKVGIAQLRSQNSTTANPATAATKEARTFVTDIETSTKTPLSDIYKNDRHNYGQYLNQLINHLASGWPNLSRVTVNRIIRSHFAQDATADPRTQALIKQLFAR